MLTKSVRIIAVTALVLCTSCLAAAATDAPQAQRLTIASGAPGNVFAQDTKMAFHISGDGAVKYSITDFWGHTVVAQALAPMGDELVLPALPPGWYEMHCVDAHEEVAVSFGVVLNRKGVSLPRSGRIAADAASAWLIKDESLRLPFARLVALAGIPWVRERTSWGRTEPVKGSLNWSAYDSTMKDLSSQGVNIDQIWHDSPQWTHAGRKDTRAADDLRDVYNWTYAASRHWSREIGAWEVWNEEDAPGFWPDLGDRFAALQKAAYWGIKDGNPSATVLMGSSAQSPKWKPSGNFCANIYESGITDYFDKFNWHEYNRPDLYAEWLDQHEDFLAVKNAAIRPSWLTEGGIGLKGTDGADHRLLTATEQATQARFVGCAGASALAAGIERYFFFVLPDYLENGVQFGALKPDLTPYPSFISLSCAANILGEARYKGRYPAPSGVTALLFDTPAGSVLACWSKEPGNLAVLAKKNSVTVANIFGAQSSIPSVHGVAQVPVGEDVVYVLGAPLQVKPEELRPASHAVTTRAPKPSRIVLSGFAIAPEDQRIRSYVYAVAKPFEFMVQAYNFDKSATHSGTIDIALPSGWTASPQGPIACRLAPMERLSTKITVTPTNVDRIGFSRIALRGHFGAENVAPSVSDFAADPSTAPIRSSQPLDILPAARWQAGISSNGVMTATDISNGLRISATFADQGDRWVYPSLTFNQQLDLSRFDGIAFDLRTNAQDDKTIVRMMLVEAGGAAFMQSAPSAPGDSHVIILFKDMDWGPFSPPAQTDRLDAKTITGIKFGANTPADHVTIEVSNVRAISCE
ncbi:MAG: hypothetical protein P4L33_21460 [Capsulimonadaceae bacterium]|nr:hypothetical protein [Capsulimonadaceae bacterium]